MSTSSGVQGGLSRGFRTWSAKSTLTPGSWRVLVERGDGRAIGGQHFEVLAGPHPEPVWATRAYK